MKGKAPTISGGAGISEQESLLPFLLNPNSYPHRPRNVRLIQTHSSFVFIAGPLTFKIKKPVNFGFLDFSTLEKRRHFCEREVFLNRRLSPGMYLGVQPISKLDGTFAFGAVGQIVEYAVKMRTLSGARFMDRLLGRGLIERGDIDRIVGILARFYQDQFPLHDIQEWGRVSRLKISTDENFRQTEPFIGKTISKAAFGAIQRYTQNFYSTHGRLFAQRIAESRIRDCHGDLHLEHIHITPRHLHIYDCIEFNDRFRYIDVANDAAFLAMDLDYENQADLAHRFVRSIAVKLRDRDMTKLIDFYKCYRAFVRGKVESLHSITHAAPEAERKSAVARAARYFRLALQYSVADSRPMVLVVMGRIASGKTTLARELSEELGWKHFSSDRIRKEMAGFPLFERTAEAARSALYSNSATEKTYASLAEAALREIAEGRSAILDATFARRELRRDLIGKLTKKRIRFQFIETVADDATIKRRLVVRETARDEVSDARLEDFASLTALYKPPIELPKDGVIRVPTERATPSVSRTLQWLATAQSQGDKSE